MIQKKHNKSRLYLQMDEFKIDDDLEHLFSTRIGWNQDDLLSDLSNIFDTRKEKIYTVTQVHGNEVEIIRGQNKDEISSKKRDGLITDQRGIVLVTYHADCIPIYFYDRVKKVIGIAHSGWKGTLKNISKTMIDIFKEEYKSSTDDIIVAIGPGIGSCCYEIGEDLKDLFSEKFVSIEKIISIKGKKIHLNLWEANKINLLTSGIKDENIVESLFCTACNIDNLYSYRREARKDRMIAAIRLKNKDD